MEENKIEKAIITNPEEISSLLIEITNINIFEKTRVRNIIEHRAFFCYLLKKKFDMGPTSISAFMRTKPKLKTYDHATVIHALKMFKVYKPYRKEYFDTLETYFDIDPNDNEQPLPVLENIVNQYVICKSNYNKANKKIKKYEAKLKDLKENKKKLTPNYSDNEILYRKLNKKHN